MDHYCRCLLVRLVEQLQELIRLVQMAARYPPRNYLLVQRRLLVLHSLTFLAYQAEEALSTAPSVRLQERHRDGLV
jgi:hypothetical protein